MSLLSETMVASSHVAHGLQSISSNHCLRSVVVRQQRGLPMLCVHRGAAEANAHAPRSGSCTTCRRSHALAGELLRQIPTKLCFRRNFPSLEHLGSRGTSLLSQRSAPARGRAEQTSSCRGAVTPGSTLTMTRRSVALCLCPFEKERLSTATGIRRP